MELFLFYKEHFLNGMTCSSIVSCLQEQNLSPIAYSSHERPDEPASNSLIDTPDNFHTVCEIKLQWWAIDFKKIVGVSSYSIASNSNCHYIRQWHAYTSINNNTWTLVDDVYEEVKHRYEDFVQNLREYLFYKK